MSPKIISPTAGTSFNIFHGGRIWFALVILCFVVVSPHRTFHDSANAQGSRNSPRRNIESMVVPRSHKSRVIPTASQRKGPRLSSARSAFSVSTERPPVVIEWTSYLIRVGYAEKCKPLHIIPWRHDNNQTAPKTEMEWHQIVGPMFEQIWNLLMTPPSTRRVVLIGPPYMERTWEVVVLRGLWNLGVPAVVLVNSLETVPIAMGWSRGMVVQVGMTETWCMAHADGHALKNTLQGRYYVGVASHALSCAEGIKTFIVLTLLCYFRPVVQSGYNSAAKVDGTVHTSWTTDMDKHWLNERNPESILMAVVKCLEASSIEVRRDLISNIVFCGDAIVLVPDIGRRVIERLRSILQHQTEILEEEPTSDLTIVPGSFTSLAPLAIAAQAISTLPHQPDTISWIGASLWATIRHHHDDEDAHVSWTFAPTSIKATVGTD